MSAFPDFLDTPPKISAFLDLVEAAFLAGLIDGETLALAIAWVRANGAPVQ